MVLLHSSDIVTCIYNTNLFSVTCLHAVVECEVVVPENGNATYNGTVLGSMVEYTCDEGYVLMGLPLQICLENDSLSGNEPVMCDCKLISKTVSIISYMCLLSVALSNQTLFTGILHYF